VYGLASSSSTPALPASVNPPKNLSASYSGDSPAAAPEPAVQRTGSVRTASADPSSKSSGFFGNLFSDSGSSVSNLFGMRKDDVPPPPNKQPATKASAGQARPTPPRTLAAPTRPAAPTKPTQIAEQPASIPATATALAATPAPAKGGLMAGAAPVMPSNSFESRWGSFR
jgi:hypothetical protein